jgi:predicted nucleic acid-binding protein
MIIVDASAALAWILPGQMTAAAISLLDEGGAFYAPEIFEIEVRNVFLKAERRGLISPADADTALGALDELIQMVSAPADKADVFALARSEALSYFDAHYLHLAERANGELASRDGALLSAAVRRGVRLRDLR